jgi:hypothetical protein
VPSPEPSSEVSREEFDALKAHVGALEEIIKRLHQGAVFLQDRLDELVKHVAEHLQVDPQI